MIVSHSQPTETSVSDWVRLFPQHICLEDLLVLDSYWILICWRAVSALGELYIYCTPLKLTECGWKDGANYNTCRAESLVQDVTATVRCGGPCNLHSIIYIFGYVHTCGWLISYLNKKKLICVDHFPLCIVIAHPLFVNPRGEPCPSIANRRIIKSWFKAKSSKHSMKTAANTSLTGAATWAFPPFIDLFIPWW